MTLKLDPKSSERLTILKFPLIVGVVFIHAYVKKTGEEIDGLGSESSLLVLEFLRNFISQGIARLAVPLFFLMSGYLFFYGFDFSLESFFKKLKSRVKTLLIPFLLWNLATLALVALIQANPLVKEFFGWKVGWVSSYSFNDYLAAIFGIGRAPVAYQFWFVRDLMLLILGVPLFHFLFKYLPLPFLFLLFLGWISGYWPIYVPHAEATLFFSIGAFIGTKGKSLFALDRYGIYAIALYFPLALANAYFFTSVFYPYLHRIGILFGVISGLFFTQFLMESPRVKKALIGLSGVSFFVFAAHEPLLTLTRNILSQNFWPQSPKSAFGPYLFTPILVLILLVLTYSLFSKVAPRLLNLVTGGRN